MNLMADVSVLLKRDRGLSVSAAPAESYLDPLAPDPTFSLGLNLFPRPWDGSAEGGAIVREAGFEHAGRQSYAYVLHRAGEAGVQFDWVAVQLYEAYSRYLHESTVGARRVGEEDADADADLDAVVTAQIDGAVNRAVAFFDGFDVNLPQPYGTSKISLYPSRLVLGFANGWADGTKFVRVEQKALDGILLRLKVRGIMFWTIEEEGADGIYMVDMIRDAISRSEDSGHDHDEVDDEDDSRSEEEERPAGGDEL